MLRVINLSLDVPVEMSVEDDVCLYLMNFTYKVVRLMNIHHKDDGTNDYTVFNTYPIMEIKGGLAYYNYGWKIFPLNVQERYADYIAEKELLIDKNNQ